MSYKVNIGLSNKHVHLSQADLEKLFGEGYELTPSKPLVQPGPVSYTHLDVYKRQV